MFITSQHSVFPIVHPLVIQLAMEWAIFNTGSYIKLPASITICCQIWVCLMTYNPVLAIKQSGNWCSKRLDGMGNNMV